jgi:hypothetical protein
MIKQLKSWIFRQVLSKVKHQSFSTYYTADSALTDLILRKKYSEFSLSQNTPLCKLMSAMGSDKGIGWHNYTKVYSSLFSELSIHHLFEMGIGTTNTAYKDNMGMHGKPGASLKAWKVYLPKAQIVGADIDPEVVFAEQRINCYVCDQTKPESIRKMWSQIEIPNAFQVMIDDGYHNFEANKTLFENSIHKLDIPGYYIIEDISNLNLGKWDDIIRNVYLTQYPHLVFRLCCLPNLHNALDNNLLIIHHVANTALN